MTSSKKCNSRMQELQLPLPISEISKLNPKLLRYKMSEMNLSEDQKESVRRARRLERARIYEQKKRSKQEFEINMLEAERNALLAVLDDLNEEVAQLRKFKRLYASIVNTQQTAKYTFKGVEGCQQQQFNTPNF